MSEPPSSQERIAVIGLGYVGLPVALAFAARFAHTVGYDTDKGRVHALQAGRDVTRSVAPNALRETPLRVTGDLADLREATFYVVTVPTPIDDNHQPDLSSLVAAARAVGSVLGPGDVVVFESTVYPGVTEEVCAPMLAEASGMEAGRDFFVAYSPERINPGDEEHTLEDIVKVVGANDGETLARVAQCYEAIVPAGVHRTGSIQVAEAAKVMENTQRDLNIALMNELSLILDRLDIPTREVLRAAGTKWNFLPFRPGLVGGHCIGVDPYYLTARAQAVGYHPEVILAGRRINDGMGRFVARKLVKMLIRGGCQVPSARVAILGLSFKENVPDTRNSGVPLIVEELATFGLCPLVHDPVAEDDASLASWAMGLSPWDDLSDLDGLVLAVPHDPFLDRPIADLLAPLKDGGILMDVCAALHPPDVPRKIRYWSL